MIMGNGLETHGFSNHLVGLTTNYLLQKRVFSDGKIVDVTLKKRLEHKMYTWFRQMNLLIAVKPDVIFEKDPTALPAQCNYFSVHLLIIT